MTIHSYLLAFGFLLFRKHAPLFLGHSPWAGLEGIFQTWDDKNEGKVSWAQITTPVGDGEVPPSPLPL